MKLVKYLLVIILLVSGMNVHTQDDRKQLVLEDIYKSGTYRLKSYGPVRWMKDNTSYSTLIDNSTIGGKDIVRIEVVNGMSEILVSARDLIPEGRNDPLEIRDYIWSEDNTKLMIFTNTRKVWRYHTRGDYWVLDLATMELYQLGKRIDRATLMFAKFSPNADRVAYVSLQNIYVEELGTDQITQLTTDGGGDIINGTFDWVYEEELSCRDGFRWSPDGQYISYWQSDTRGTGTFYLINNIDSIYSQPIALPYPKVGTDNSAVKIGVVSSRGGETRWMEVPGDPRNNYLARMDFIPGSNEVMIQQLNRKQNRNTVWVADVETLALSKIMVDSDEAFLNIHDNIQWLDDNQAFTWTSERDGWRHLYKVSRDGKQQSLITRGDFDVVRINRIDPLGGFVYYIASPENYTQRYLYRSRIDGNGPAQRVSPEGKDGQHSYQISNDARYAIHTYQNAQSPPAIDLVELPTHRMIRTLQDNKEVLEAYRQLGLNPKEFFKVVLQDIDLDAWMIKPVGFDPMKKYPIVFYVYGEPAGSTVQDNWGGGDLWHQYLAQQGFVVVSIDNRGTRTPRGRDWRKSIYGQIGILAAHDQAAAAKKIFSMYDFIDTNRVGIWGWSGGGQMTMNCLFRYPEIYSTGIAVAFVADQRLYDNIYQERYMGLLTENMDNYIDGSPISHAHKLQGDLMIMHGTADDNVHYQSFERLANELIKHDKQFSMMSYPMRAHGIRERENTSLHLRKTMARYWEERLKVNRDKSIRP